MQSVGIYFPRTSTETRGDDNKNAANCKYFAFFAQNIWSCQKKAVPLQPIWKNGTLPERLGIGLQNRGRRFESARYLQRSRLKKRLFWFYLTGNDKRLLRASARHLNYPNYNGEYIINNRNNIILQLLARTNMCLPTGNTSQDRRESATKNMNF